VKRSIKLAAMTIAVLAQGCAATHPATALSAGDAVQVNPTVGTNNVSAIVLSQDGKPAAQGEEINIDKSAPIVEGHPLTSVVVTQCNLVVAVYMTMPDGRLLRFDRSANVAAEDLVSIAYTAGRSERVEVSCEGTGVAGYETHAPT
jgi:hypothetical protein